MKAEEVLVQVHKIADRYGYEAQSRQCIEEMAELTQAINKAWRTREKITDFDSIDRHPELIEARDHMIEEIADVQITLWQMIYMLGAEATGEVHDMILKKLARQMKRMEAADEDKQCGIE